MLTPGLDLDKASDSKNHWLALPVINRKMALRREGRKVSSTTCREQNPGSGKVLVVKVELAGGGEAPPGLQADG